jgi:hypothetical protein
MHALSRILVCAWVLYSLTPGYILWNAMVGYDTNAECRQAWIRAEASGARAETGPLKGDLVQFKCLPVGVQP